MSLIKIGSGAPASELDFGSYRMRLHDVSIKSITVDNEDKEVFEWVMGVPTVEPPTDDTQDDIIINGLTSTMTGPKSKTMAFVAALLGYTPEAGVELNPPDLIGKWAIGTIGPNKNGYPKVESLMAEPKAPAARAAAAPAAAAPIAAQVAPAPQAPDTVTDDLPF